LKVEFVDLLKLAFQSEEESGLVRLQRGLRVLESSAIGERLLGRKDWGFAQVLDELWLMLAMIAGFFFIQACTHLLEGLVVDETSCILGYVKLSLLDVLAELPTMSEISVSPPGLPG
jgi:hypothetical protein